MSTKLLVGVLLILTPMLALLLGGAQLNYTRARLEVIADLTRTAQLAAVLIDRTFSDDLALAQTLASDPIISTIRDDQLDAYLSRLLLYHPDLENLVVVDAAGQEIGAAVRSPAGRITVADRPYFQQVMATGVPVLSGVVIGRIVQRPVVVAAAPITMTTGAPRGAALVAVKLDPIASALRGIALSPAQNIFLVDPSGRVAFATARPDLPWAERDLSALPDVRAALGGRLVQTDAFQSPLGPDTRVAALAPIPRFGWAVGATVPVAQAFGPIDQAHRQQLLLFAGVALVAILGAIGLADSLSRPLRRLTSAAVAIGQGDLGRRVTVRTGDEIETLGNAFNAMAVRLQATIEQLQATSGRLLAIFDHIAEVVAVVDVSGRLIDLNAAGLALVGLRRDALGRPLSEYRAVGEIRYPDGRPLPLSDLLLRYPLAGEPLTIEEAILRTSEGEERIVQITALPARDDEGRVRFAVLVLRDLTEQRRRERQRTALARIAQHIAASQNADQALAIAVEELVASFEAALARVWIWDDEAGLLVLRASAGLSNRTATTGSAYALFRPGESKIGTIAATHQSIWTNDLPHASWLRDPAWVARERIVAFAGFPLLSADRLLGVLAIFSRRRLDKADVVALGILADQLAVAIEQAHLVTRLRTALHLRDEFIAAAAHELRTPATILKGYGDLLIRVPEARSGELVRTLRVMARSVQRVTDLARDLILWSDLQRGALLLRQETFDLAELVRRVVAEARAEHPHHQFRLDQQPAYVTADRERIAEVVRRLIENAVRYQPAGGPIDIAVRSRAGEAIVSIRDHGYGIPLERRPYVFEPMYEPIPPGSPGYIGVIGFGLAISKQLIERSGGRIWFESSVGEGSIFSFALPLASATATE